MLNENPAFLIKENFLLNYMNKLMPKENDKHVAVDVVPDKVSDLSLVQYNIGTK